MVPDTLTGGARPVDALRFLKRGTALLDTLVLVRKDEASFNGVRITPTLVLTLRLDMNFTGARVTIDDATVTVAFASDGDAMLLRTPTYDGSLAELSFTSTPGSVSLAWMNPAGEPTMAFGRVFAEGEHDVPTEPGSAGAPLFDDTWGILGLHKTLDSKTGKRAFIPISKLLRELEQSSCWDEIAKVHRVVRTAPAEPAKAVVTVAPDLGRAVRWSVDDTQRLSERQRKRALAGKTLAELRAARGTDAAATPEQRAIDRILKGGPYALDTIDDDILLPFATAARWFRPTIAGLPDDESLARQIDYRRQQNALTAIIGPHFTGREAESRRLEQWLADRRRRALVVLGSGGIGKSALLAHFIREKAASIRYAWIDLDRPDVSADESILRVVDRQLAWQSSTGTLLAVLDSFETAVQTFGYTNLNSALDVLARRFNDLAVVVGTRAPVPLLKVQGEPAESWDLAGLPIEVVQEWLEREGVAPAIAAGIAPVTNGVPLNMKLALDLVKGKSDAEARDIVASLPKQLVTGYLYRRILRRLNDDTLKDQAQWAMVPRRLVPDLLAQVAGVPSGEAERLFTALRSEVTLLEGDKVLTVRADLRNTLLPLLEADDATRVRKIDGIAADFWDKQGAADADVAEAIYHALRLGDTARAERLWRSGVAKHMGTYVMDELPAESRLWLEARLSSERLATQAARQVARGDAAAASRTLRSQPGAVETLSADKRRQRIEELAAKSNLTQTPPDTSPSVFENIVLTSARPSMLVRTGRFKIDSKIWSARLEPLRAITERAIASTGRIQLEDGAVLGSAACIGSRLFITTRSIVEQFAVGVGQTIVFIDGRKAMLNMRAEAGASGKPWPITHVVLLHPFWDVAIVEVGEARNVKPLALASREPALDSDIVVIGHPRKNPEEQDLQSRIFGDAFDVKRVMPGEYVGRQAEQSFGHTVSAGCEDAGTLGPDPGAAVIDPRTGELLGVRFSWVFLSNAKFVPAWELVNDPEIAAAFTAKPVMRSMRGATRALEAARQAPVSAQTVRHTLIDAYLARSSGDLSRARALLATLPSDGNAPIDQTLLHAACELTTDPMRAAQILHEMIELVPRAGWSNTDRYATIATRLRLAVDADAEQRFIDILNDEPKVATLLDRRQFRVLSPPARNLPWMNQPSARFPGTTPGLPREAISCARRIVDAATRCESLIPWIRSHADRLWDLGVLFNESGADVRGVAAAYVALPYDDVRSIADFLLDKTELAPHPTKGWTPIVKPLWTMFRDVRGRPPEGVSRVEDMEQWLDSNAKSGRFGGYLAEMLRFDATLAWQAGLLHLTTDLPIEGLLKRRFSREAS